MTWYNKRLEAITGDITKIHVDAIVNAANSSLMGGGGVDAAIHRSGGSEILAECKKIRNTQYPEGLPTGEAVITQAGALPCRHVIHTVGPIWSGGMQGEESLLENCYRNSLQKAIDAGAKSLAFPAISTGVYGYPAAKAAKLVWALLSDYIQQHDMPEKIFLVFFSDAGLKIFLRSAAQP